MEREIDPLTNRPLGGGPIDPLTGLPYKSTFARTGKLPTTGTSTFMGDTSSFSDYGLTPSPHIDMEEARAQRQSVSEKWGRGLTKAGATFLGASMEGTAGVLWGLGDWAASGFDDFDKSMTDNPFGHLADSLNEATREGNENYSTKEELAEQGTWAGMGNANFWADKAMNGLAYSAGTLASTFLTGGTGAVGGALKATGQAKKMSRALAAWKAAKATAKTGKQTLGDLRKGAAFANRAGKLGATVEAGLVMSMAEANVEAREGYTQIKQDLTDEAKKRKFTEQLGGFDSQASSQDFGGGLSLGSSKTKAKRWQDVQLDAKDLQQIELQAQDDKGALFWGNMAVLVPSNLFIWGKMMAPVAAGISHKVVKGVAGTTVRDAGKVARAASKKAGAKRSTRRAAQKDARKEAKKGPQKYMDKADTFSGVARAGYKASRVAGVLGQTAAVEGAQEGMQYALSQGVSAYELRKFNESGAGDLVDSLMNTRSLEAMRQATPDVLDKAANTFNDPEAREQVMIGAIVGLISGGVGGLRSLQSKKKGTEALSNIQNSPIFQRLGLKAESYSEATATVAAIQKAQDEGNENLAEQLRAELITSQVLFHINAGSMDMFNERLQDSKNLSTEEFLIEAGLDPTYNLSKEEQVKLVDDMLNKAKTIEKGHGIIEGMFTTSPTMGLPKMLMGKKRRDAEAELINDEKIYKEFLLHNYAKLETIDQSIGDLLSDIETLVPGASALRKEVENYKRSRFSDLTLQKDSEGNEQEKRTYPDRAELSSILEGIQKIANEELQGVQSAVVAKKLETIKTLTRDKNNASLAFDELVKDPKSRNLFVERTKARVKLLQQDAVDKTATDLIKSTGTAKELGKAMDGLVAAGADISDFAKNEVNKEAAKRRSAEAAQEDELQKLSLTAVKELTDEGLSPAEIAAKKDHIKRREDSKSEEPENVDEAEERARILQEHADGLAAEDKRKRNEAAKAAADAAEAGGTPTTPVENPPPPDSENAKGEGMYTRTEGIGGQYKLTDDGKTIVGKDGKPILSGLNKDRTLNGKPIIDGRELLQSPEVGEGTTVTLRVIEDDWWMGERDLPSNKNNESINIPIYIEIDGKIVGLLLSGNTPLRAAAVKAHRAPKSKGLSKIEVREAIQILLKKSSEAKFSKKSEGLQKKRTARIQNAFDAVKDNHADPIAQLNAISELLQHVENSKEFGLEPPYSKETLQEVFKLKSALGSAKGDSYTLTSHRNNQYDLGLLVEADFYEEPLLPEGVKIITRVDRPEIRKDGNVIQTAKIRVAQGTGPAASSPSSAVTTTIKTKSATTQVRARTVDGKPYFSNPFEVFGDVPVGVMSLVASEGVQTPKFELGNFEGKDTAGLEEFADRKAIELMSSITLGQVVYFFKDPNGNWALNVGQTPKLSTSEVEEAGTLLKNADEESYEKVTDLVGFNALDPNFLGGSSLYLRFDDRVNDFGERPIEVASTDTLVTGVDPTAVFTISNELYKQLSEGKTINAKELKGLAQSPEGTLGRDKARHDYGRLVQMPTTNSDDKVIYQGIGFDIFKDAADAQKLLDGIADHIMEVLTEKRRQISIMELKTDPEHFKNLSDTKHVEADYFEGHRGILRTDAQDIGGGRAATWGVFHDIGIYLNTIPTVGGVAQEFVPTPVAPPVVASPETNTPTENTEESTNNFDGPPSPASGYDAYLDAQAVAGAEAFDRIKAEQAAKAAEDAAKARAVSVGNKAKTPFRLGDDTHTDLMSREGATKWLNTRNIPKEFYDQALQIGSKVAHGYMKDAMVYLWSGAQAGTEYHEAFHYVFRNLVNDEQRAELYKEARIRFKESKATDLELEELMAEEFRMYVLTMGETGKSLPQKIRKFFRDMLNFVRAVFSNALGTEQLYSLIEANNIPKSYQRNTEVFKQDSPVYSLVTTNISADFAAYKQVLDTLSHNFQKQFAELSENSEKEETFRNLELILGRDEQNKGSLATFFFQNVFSTKEGEPVSDLVLATLASLTADTPKLLEYMKSKEIKLGMPTKNTLFTKEVANLTEAERRGASKIFYEIYTNWFSVTDEFGNEDRRGWRAGVIDDLAKYGYKIEGTESDITGDLDTDANTGIIDLNETNYDKIYNISHFENNPTQRATEEVRKLFGRMVKTTPNFLGFYTYADIESTYKAAVHATVGLESFNEIKEAIKYAASNFEELGPMAAYLESEVTAAEAAQLRSLLSLDYAAYNFMLEEKSEDGKMEIKVLPSDRRSGITAFMHLWKRESIRDVVAREAAIFERTSEGLKVQNNVIDGKARLTHITNALKDFYSAEEEDMGVKGAAISDILWYMSMGFSGSKDKAQRNVIKYLYENPKELPSFLGNVRSVLSKAFSVEMEGGKISKLSLKPNPVNFFVTEVSTVKAIAERAATFRFPNTQAFVNGIGKTIYPYNTGSHMSHLLRELKMKGVESEFFQNLKKDNSFSVYGVSKYSSTIFRLAQSAKFELNTFSFDSLLNESLDVADPATKLTERNSMIVRMNAFLNSGNNLAHYPVPVQETRPRLDFITLPKFDNRDSMQKSGLARQTRSQVLTGIVIRDLIKIADNPGIENNLQNGFHLKGIVNTDLGGGLKLSAVVQDAIKYESSEKYADFFEDVRVQVENYLETTFNDHVNAYESQVEEFGILQEIANGMSNTANTRLSAAGLEKYSSRRKFLESYVFNDTVARIEIAGLLRGGATQFKNIKSFYKRMGLVNTPGTRLMIRGEFEKDPTYGFFKEVHEATILPIALTDIFHDQNAANYEKLAIARGLTKKEAAEMTAAYKSDAKNVDLTDAIAIISPKFARALEQGHGKWSKEDDVWWENFLKTGKRNGRFSAPHKYYYENLRALESGQLAPEMDKNSYMELSPELVEGNAFLEDLYDRMTAQGVYKGLKEVHLINTSSAKKGHSGKQMDANKNVASRFFDLEVNIQDGTKFLQPQIINNDEGAKARLNKQVRKALISALRASDPDSKYTYRGDQVSATTLYDTYQQALKSLLLDSQKKVYDEMGWTELAAAVNDANTTQEQLQKLRLNAFQKFRSVVMDSAVRDGDLDSNMQEQMRLVQDEMGNIDFSIPPAFPAYERKLSNFIFSIHKNNIYKLDFPGKELVQIPAMGKYLLPGEEVARELRHLAVDEDGNISSSEIMISEDLADKLKLKVGDTMILYRIPNQGYSLTYSGKIVKFLPKGYSKSVAVAGHMVTQTNADFDVDKLFTIARNNTEEGDTAKNQNIIFDIMEAITLSKHHFIDTIKPLEQDELNELAARPEIHQDVVYTFDHPLTETKLDANYKSANVLVGGYANGLAGFSVAVHSASDTLSLGLSIHPSKIVRVRKGNKLYVLDTISAISKMTGRLSNATLTERLSAALDAAKELIHTSINDNPETFNATIFLASIGMDAETTVYLLAQPLVREFVFQRSATGESAWSVFNSLGVPRHTLKDIKANTYESSKVLSVKEFTGIIKADDVTSDSAKEGLIAFAQAYYAGKELQDVYSAITPDTKDNLNDLAELLAYKDSLSELYRRQGESLISFSQIERILDGNDYLLSNAFHTIQNDSLEVSNLMFLGATPAVSTFKENLKDITGKTRWNAKEHRFIQRSLFYHMLTQEGSPVGQLLDKDYIKKLLLDPNNNIYTAIKNIQKQVPALENNTFLNKIKEGKRYNDPKNRVYSLDFESIEKMTPELRQEMISQFELLFLSPEQYTEDPKLQVRIKNLAKALVVNALVTTGLAPAYSAYYESIPEKFWRTVVDENGVDTYQYFRTEFEKAKTDPNYFNNHMPAFIRNYGTRSIDGRHLLPTLPGQMIDPNTVEYAGIELRYPDGAQPENPPKFAIRRDRNRAFDKVRLYQWNQDSYMEIQTQSLGKDLNEVNLRESDGSISTTSLWAKGSSALTAEIIVKGNKSQVLKSVRTGSTTILEIDMAPAPVGAKYGKFGEKRDC